MVEVFVEKSNGYLKMFKEAEGNNDELIEDLKAHTVCVNSKWQQFLAFKNKIDQKIKETDESDISPC